jgi:hypothetical protein
MADHRLLVDLDSIQNFNGLFRLVLTSPRLPSKSTNQPDNPLTLPTIDLSQKAHLPEFHDDAKFNRFSLNSHSNKFFAK